ncbi:TauD/TfdA dioxygenase family protein [Rhodococcus tukisamuensis]|uniref:Taurine dioxygenase n=1 Tax=Rhodococcus tukisamuensis TaxID=168276 RepID=A0A1G7AV58_9NOCA|nr:TauD/TfdA family dioxygenase [Rhodococcus tukisamuensis]SDE18729.1 taurine dioxygenase [Rhodococcus tukisamuensis]
MKVTPLTGAIGASVEGIRLDEPIGRDVFETLHTAFLERCTLVFRGQHISPTTQVQFARLWGDPVVTAMLNPLDGNPEVVQLTNIKKETTATEAWHYDAAFTEAPPKISILSAVTVPAGGDTMWSNQYLAYENLSAGLQKTVRGLNIRFHGLRLGRMMNVAEDEIPTAVHPLVRTHPETGRKALYVGHRENVCIDGWSREESADFLEYLYTASVTPDNVYRHMWQEGDVVMWDNRCTMHYAVHDYDDADRVLNRVTLHGEVPA